MDDSPGHLDTLRLLRRAARKHWKLILGCFAATAIPVIVWTLVLVPKTFEAMATIFIEDPRTSSRGLLGGLIPPSDASLQLAILRSRSLAEAVVENLSRQAAEELLGKTMQGDYLLEAQNKIRHLLGLELIVLSPQQRMLGELQQARVTFTALPSGEIRIRAVAYDPRIAMELANGYVEVLQARTRSYAREEAKTTREFIETFLNQTKGSLQEAEEALVKFQRRDHPIGITQRSSLELTKLAQLENTLVDLQASKEIAKVRLNFLRGGKDVTGKALPSATRLLAQQHRDRLAQLEDKLATLLEKYTQEHPQVVATQAEIADVRESLGAALQAVQNPRPATDVQLGPAERAGLAKQMTALEVEISSLEAREESLRPRIALLTQTLSSFSGAEMEAINARRKADIQRNLFTLLSDRLGTARIQEQAETRGVRVIDMAALPGAASHNPLNKKTILGLLMGLGLGLGVATLIEYFNRPVETDEDVIRATSLPVLGWLPRLELPRARHESSRRLLNLVEARAVASLSAEGLRSIRTSLEALARIRPLRTLMLTSPGPREGKSTILINLGLVFRELGRRLVVVDTDLRRPSLHLALRSPSTASVAELLESGAELEKVRGPVESDFLILPAGATKSVNPGAALSAEKVRRFLDLLRGEADLVLFDSAPVLAVSDNLTLASMVDGVILVVRAGRTQSEDLIRAKDQLEKVGATILGVVINQVSPTAARRYYRRYADYYAADDPVLRSRAPWNPRSWRRSRNAGSTDDRSTL